MRVCFIISYSPQSKSILTCYPFLLLIQLLMAGTAFFRHSIPYELFYGVHFLFFAMYALAIGEYDVLLLILLFFAFSTDASSFVSLQLTRLTLPKGAGRRTEVKRSSGLLLLSSIIFATMQRCGLTRGESKCVYLLSTVASSTV